MNFKKLTLGKVAALLLTGGALGVFGTNLTTPALGVAAYEEHGKAIKAFDAERNEENWQAVKMTWQLVEDGRKALGR
jgi:hypothetical protein